MTGFLPPDRYVGNPVFLVSPFFPPFSVAKLICMTDKDENEKDEEENKTFSDFGLRGKVVNNEIEKKTRGKKTLVFRTKKFWTLFFTN